MDCDACRRFLAAYGDNELSVESALDVECHVLACSHCRVLLERQRAFSQTLRDLYPREAVPAGLEDHVRRALRTAPAARFWLHGLALAASILLVVGLVWTLTARSASNLPASVVAAARIHQNAGEPALAIRSADPATVNAWLADALSFPISAPVQQTTAMALEGAAVLDVAGERAGYVQYHRDGHLISLFLLPPRAWRDAGRHVQVRGVEFHLYTIDGLNLIAWNHPPLSYVLVSDLGGQGGQACAACHGSMADDALIVIPRAGEI